MALHKDRKREMNSWSNLCGGQCHISCAPSPGRGYSSNRLHRRSQFFHHLGLQVTCTHSHRRWIDALCRSCDVVSVSTQYTQQHQHPMSAQLMHTSTHAHACTCAIILRPSWTLSGTTWVSQHQKGKTNLDLLEKEMDVASAGLYANLHLTPDR